MELIGADVSDLSSTKKFHKIQEIIRFFQGKEDKGFVIKKLLMGKPGINKLDFLFEYIGLRKAHQQKSDELKTLKDSSSLLESVSDQESRKKLESLFNDTNIKDLKAGEISKIEQELALYEQ